MASLSRAVMARSAALGFGLFEGCWCPRMTAALLVLNLPASHQRAVALNSTEAVVVYGIDAIAAHAGVPVFKDVEDF